jgi:hypothetical protein
MTRIVQVPADAIPSEGGLEALEWPSKDPEEELDYGLDWAARLEDGETIAASEWFYEFPPGENILDVFGETFSDQVSKLWLRSGVAGRTYTITNNIMTSEDRVLEQSVRIKVLDR